MRISDWSSDVCASDLWRSCADCLQIEGFERAVLLQVDTALPREFERGEKARRDRRTAQRTIVIGRKKGRKLRPVERDADQPREMMERRVERHHRAPRNHVDDGLAPQARKSTRLNSSN